jgi:hypothetical protein
VCWREGIKIMSMLIFPWKNARGAAIYAS